jgi:hypothetical protein
MKYSAFFDPMKILQFTLTNQSERISFENADYLIIRSRIIDFIAQAAERLGISQNAVFLAVQLLDRYVAQN